MTSISFISSAAAEANSITLPTHAAGDLIIVGAWRTGSSSAVTMPSGWFQGPATLSGSGPRWLGWHWKIALTAAEMSGTWTNATGLIVAVYRDTGRVIFFGGNRDDSQDATLIYPAILGVGLETLGSRFQSTGWVVGIGACTQDDANARNPPTGMTTRQTLTGGSTGSLSLHDTNGDVTSWASKNVSASGSVNWCTCVGSIEPLPVPGGSGMRRAGGMGGGFNG